MTTFLLCTACDRHFRPHEPRCPFCGASATGLAPRPVPQLASGASRSHRYAASAALLAGGTAFLACGTGGTSSPGAVATGRACTGYEDTGECRTVADCPESVSGRRTYCAHAQTGDSRCGNPFFEPQCPMDGCGEGMVCVAFGVCGGTQCQPECTDATCSGTSYCVDRVCEPKPCDIDGANPCPNDHECDPEASNNPNGCVPLSCSGDPALCHPWQECEPNTAGANLFGCLTKSCTADEGCGDCGYCVNQNCSPTLANCYEELPAMPYGCVWPEEELV